MAPEETQNPHASDKEPELRQVMTWAAIAAVLAALGYFGAWPWLGAVPLAWLAWIVGRRVAGIGPERPRA